MPSASAAVVAVADGASGSERSADRRDETVRVRGGVDRREYTPRLRGPVDRCE